MGGASDSPIIKAVLDNIGRRYLVEHWENEDGTAWYDRYSDGLLEQGGNLGDGVTAIPNTNSIVFPIEFRDTKYVLTLGSPGAQSTQSWHNGIKIKTKQTTGFDFTGLTKGDAIENGTDWRARGYAA